MNLKEAFQAQNRLGELLTYIVRYLSDTDNVTTVTEKHLRSKALAGQQDDDVDASRKSDEGFDVGKLLDIWQQLMAERDALGNAIGKAKVAMEFNLDAAVDANKKRRTLLTTLQRMAGCKSTHEIQKGAGKGYVFNKDGNQTEYFYDIDRIVTIDYDRKRIRSLLKELAEEANQISLKIDGALLATEVDYKLPFDLSGDDSIILEELMEE